MNMQIASHTMITMPLTHPGFSEAQARGPSNETTCFEPLDPGVISASIPTFFVGRDRDGFWLARDTKGERAASSCSKARRSPLHGGLPGLSAAQQFSRRSGSIST